MLGGGGSKPRIKLGIREPAVAVVHTQGNAQSCFTSRLYIEKAVGFTRRGTFACAKSLLHVYSGSIPGGIHFLQAGKEGIQARHIPVSLSLAQPAWLCHKELA